MYSSQFTAHLLIHASASQLNPLSDQHPPLGEGAQRGAHHLAAARDPRLDRADGYVEYLHNLLIVEVLHATSISTMRKSGGIARVVETS